MANSPWGNGGEDTPPGGGGGSRGSGGRRPPNFDDLAGQFQDQLKKIFPKNMPGSGRPIFLFIIIVAALWLGSGFYRVLPDEQGVVMRFGKYVNQTQPGLHYHIPFPVERVLTPKVTRVNRIDVGYRSAADSGRAASVNDVPEESLMLTGDENIVDIDYSVFWVIKDAGKFLFNIQDPEDTVKSVAETAMR